MVGKEPPGAESVNADSSPGAASSTDGPVISEDVPPPPEPYVDDAIYIDTDDEDGVVIPEHSKKQRKNLKKEAFSLNHLMGHDKFNPYCRTCRDALSNRTANRRRKVENIEKPKRFAQMWTADHFHGKDKKLTESICGDKSVLVVYDLGG